MEVWQSEVGGLSEQELSDEVVQVDQATGLAMQVVNQC